ncbi:MAG TPA: hypothetical protein VKZ63_07780 [Kofleriaceae bacterium]|nr:hypothetical protein [Kofleriaceae bacterium]
MRPAGLAVLLVLCCAAGACAGRQAASAAEPAPRGVAAYLSALRSDDPRRAYALLADDVRKDVPYETFAAEWKASAAEREHQARALEEDLRAGADLGERALVTFPDGTTLGMQRQSGAWRLDVPLLSRTHAATPHVAIELLAAALSERDYDAVMRILTARRREGIGKQVDAFTDSLERHLKSSKDRVGFVGKDRAELQWSDGGTVYKIVLRLEGGEWRVDDVHAWPAPPEAEEPDSGEEEKAGEGDEASPGAP